MAKIFAFAVIILTVLGAGTVVTTLVRAGTAPLSVWVFDVGQGDAIFIDGPEKQMLVDGGPDALVLEKLGEVLWPWDRTLDLLVLTHPHTDHVAGLNAVLERYVVDETYVNGEVYDEPPAVAFAEAVDEKILVQGDVIDLGDGATLRVLWPEVSLAGTTSNDPNDGSIVMLLTYGETSILLTGDAGVEEEEAFLTLVPDIDVLKVGHHGSDTSTSPALLATVKPEIAIISSGEGNSYGHPSPIVLDRLRSAGAEIFRTDEDGDIRLSSWGGEVWVRAFSL